MSLLLIFEFRISPNSVDTLAMVQRRIEYERY